jgi:hypothetical protein
MPDGDENTAEVSQALTCGYNVYAATISVVKDQRTKTLNYEGKLELRFKLGEPNSHHPYHDYYDMGQGEQRWMNIFVDGPTVQSSSVQSYHFSLEEYDYGVGLGGGESGEGDVTLPLDCSKRSVSAYTDVQLTDAGPFETNGTIRVSFRGDNKNPPQICGDLICEGTETEQNCYRDCHVPVCGDQICDQDEQPGCPDCPCLEPACSIQ